MQSLALRTVLIMLHRARTRGPGVLAVFAILVSVIGPFAFAIEAHETHSTISWHEGLYYTAGLFTLQGNRFGYPQSIILRVLYFIAPAISTSAVLGAFIHLLEERTPMFARRFRGHTVIAGLGNLGTTLAREMQKFGHPFIGIERREDAPEVSNLRSSGTAVVIVGDMTSAEVLRKARCHRAARVFLTAPSDVVNLDAAFNIRGLARAERVAVPPTIYAHVYDVALSDSLQDQLHAHHDHDAPIVPFNSYRFAAKALLAVLLRDKLVTSLRVAPGLALVRTAWPDGDTAVREVAGPLEMLEDRRRLLLAFRLEREAGPSVQDRYTVVGLGRFGRSVMRELIDAVPLSARFMVVERSRESFDVSAESFSPEEKARFDVFIGDATSRLAVGEIEKYRPNAVMVCTDNDISNLRLSLDLHRRSVRTVTRMFDLEASTELGRGLDERGISPMGLARLFRTAIPILTHERHLRACLNLDIDRTPQVDHLFYLAKTNPAESKKLGDALVHLDEFPRADDVPMPPTDLGLVWHRSVQSLTPTVDDAEAVDELLGGEMPLDV